MLSNTHYRHPSSTLAIISQLSRHSFHISNKSCGGPKFKVKLGSSVTLGYSVPPSLRDFNLHCTNSSHLTWLLLNQYFTRRGFFVTLKPTYIWWYAASIQSIWLTTFHVSASDYEDIDALVSVNNFLSLRLFSWSFLPSRFIKFIINQENGNSLLSLDFETLTANFYFSCVFLIKSTPNHDQSIAAST